MARSVAARLATGRHFCSASAQSSSTASEACMLVSGWALGRWGASLTWRPVEQGHGYHHMMAFWNAQVLCFLEQAHDSDRH